MLSVPVLGTKHMMSFPYSSIFLETSDMCRIGRNDKNGPSFNTKRLSVFLVSPGFPGLCEQAQGDLHSTLFTAIPHGCSDCTSSFALLSDLHRQPKVWTLPI